MNVSQILRIKLPFDEVYPLPHYKHKIFKILERLVERHLESNSKTGWSCKIYFLQTLFANLRNEHFLLRYHYIHLDNAIFNFIEDLSAFEETVSFLKISRLKSSH